MMKAACFLACGLVVGCTPFVESNEQETRVGVVINHEKATKFIFDLFSHPDSSSTIGEK